MARKTKEEEGLENDDYDPKQENTRAKETK